MHKNNKLVSIFMSLALFTGCASTISGKDEKSLENNYSSGKFIDAAMVAEQALGFFDPKTGEMADVTATKVENALLHMNAAEAQRLSGNKERAIAHYNVVDENLFQKLDTDFITTGYDPTPHEKVLTNFYKSISYWGDGDVDNARIEFNRANERTRLAVQRYESMINEQKEKAEKKSSKLLSIYEKPEIAELTGDWDVFDDFTNPIVTYMSSLFLASQNGINDNTAKDYMERVQQMTEGSDIPTDLFSIKDIKENKIWIIAETGLGPTLGEKRLDIPFTHNGTVLMLQMAFPVVEQSENSVVLSNYTVNKENVKFHNLNTMDKLVKTELKKRWPGIVASQAVQALAKAVIQYQAQKEAGALGGFLALAATSAMTGADKTIWKMTPNEWNIAKFDNPKKGLLEIRYGNTIETVEMPQKSSIIYLKQATPNSKPLIEIIEI
jgi:hypothetical protein